MSELDEINADLMGQGAKAFPFDNMGDAVTGTIVSGKKRQQTSLGDDPKPMFWDNGDPKMMTVLVLQTSLRENAEDDGKRSVYLRGGSPDVATGSGTSSAAAVREAVKRAGAQGIEIGGTLSLKWTGLGPSKRGLSPAKLYTASYKPAAMMIDADDMG